MDEPEKHENGKNPDKRLLTCDSIYMLCPKFMRQKADQKVFKGEDGSKNELQMGMKAHFKVIEMF